MLIISDIAGQYKTLMALIEKCPNDEPVSVGDMIDRGPDSKKVLDFFRKNGRAILGNHELMMLDAFLDGEFRTWFAPNNGGAWTMHSFGMDKLPLTDPEIARLDPYLEWIDKLPVMIREPGLLITHAPVTMTDVHKGMDAKDITEFVWNRDFPEERPGEFQVFGHMSRWGLRHFGNWGMCIDTSADRILTGLQWPEMNIIQQPYID